MSTHTQTRPTNSHRVCPWWVAYTFDNPLRKLVHPPEKILQPYLQEGMRVLDIGCGFGHFAIGMARIVGPDGRVTALDLQEQMLNKTMSRAKRQGVASTIAPKRCNGGDLGPAEAYDFVLASNVLHEIPDLPALAGQVCRVLKPGGLFYIMEPFGHVRPAAFEEEVTVFRKAGLLETARPRVTRERCILLQKPQVDARA